MKCKTLRICIQDHLGRFLCTATGDARKLLTVCMLHNGHFNKMIRGTPSLYKVQPYEEKATGWQNTKLICWSSQVTAFTTNHEPLFSERVQTSNPDGWISCHAFKRYVEHIKGKSMSISSPVHLEKTPCFLTTDITCGFTFADSTAL